MNIKPSPSLGEGWGGFLALLVVIIWGTTFVSSKVLLNAGLMPADIFVVRFLMAYICMIAVSHKRLWADNVLDELTMVGLGIMGGSLYFLTENMALLYSTSANVSILVSSTPLVTAFLVAIFYKSDRLNRKQLFGSVVAFIGMVLVVLNGQFVLHLNPAGDALALGASITWAFYSLFMRRIMNSYSADFITRKVFIYGLLTILPYYIIYPTTLSLDIFLQPVVIGNFLFLGLAASTGGYLLWNYVMHKLGAVKATNFVYLQSLVTMIAGGIILGEHITLMGLTGAIILILGMARAVKK